MKIIKALLFFTIITGVMHAMQKQVETKSTVPLSKTQEQKYLVFKIGGEAIAQIPVGIAKEISDVFKAQLEGPMAKDRYSIELGDESHPDTIKLFEKIVNAKIAAKKGATEAQQARIEKGLVTWLLQQNKNLLVNFYDFVDKYQMNSLIPLLAKPLMQAIAEIEAFKDMYNQQEFTFAHDSLLQDLAQAVCSTEKVFFMSPVHLFKEVKVTSFDVSPDGRDIVVAAYDRTTFEPFAHIYDQVKKNIRATIIDPKGASTRKSVKYSPQGNYIVITSKTAILIYDVLQGKIIKTLYKVRKASFDPSERYIVVISDAGAVQIYDLQKNVVETVVSGAVESAHLYGKYLITLLYDDRYKIEIRDILTKQINTTIRLANPAISVQFSPNGKIITVLVDDEDDRTTVQIDDISLKSLATLESADPISSITFSSDSRYMIIASKHTIYLYDLEKIELLENIKLADFITYKDGSIVSADISPDGNYIVVITEGAQEIIYCRRTKKVIAMFWRSGSGGAAKFNPDGNSLAILSNKEGLFLYPITMCNESAERILGMYIIRSLPENAKLNKSSWVFKVLMQLTEDERAEFIEQYPHVGTIIENSKKEEQ